MKVWIEGKANAEKANNVLFWGYGTIENEGDCYRVELANSELDAEEINQEWDKFYEENIQCVVDWDEVPEVETRYTSSFVENFDMWDFVERG